MADCPININHMIEPGKDSMTHGSTATIKCDAGFHVMGNNKISCNDGDWSADLPICADIGT